MECCCAKGWLEAATTHPHVHVLRYEEMIADYAGCMTRLGAAMGLSVQSDRPPARDRNVVQKGKRPFEPAPGADDKDTVRAVAKARLGRRLETLGYPQ